MGAGGDRPGGQAGPRLSWGALRALPASEVVAGIGHRQPLDDPVVTWRGVALDVVAGFTCVRPEPTHLICRSEHGCPCVEALDDVLGTDRSGRPWGAPGL